VHVEGATEVNQPTGAAPRRDGGDRRMSAQEMIVGLGQHGRPMMSVVPF